MKILVTGSNGLLGQKLTDLMLLYPEHTLVATARGANRYPHENGYQYVSLDLTDKSAVFNILAAHQPDVLIHTAAMTNVDQCETDHSGCDAINTLAVEYLVEACNLHAVHLIHVSTDFVFSGEKGPLTENDIPAPVSYYGHSKWKAEQIVMAHSKKWSIARAILVYGVVNDMSRSNFALWARTNLLQGKKINVVDDQFRTPTLAEDLADGCLRLAFQSKEGIYHLGGPEFKSIFELVCEAADHWKLDKSLIQPIKSEVLAQPAKRPPITGFVIEKAKQELGFHPRTFAQGLNLMDEQMNRLTK